MSASAIGIIAAFSGGIASFLSPCVLPLVPGYVGYVAGGAIGQERTSKTAAVAQSFVFVLGFGTVFVAMGASATALGQALLSYRLALNLIGGSLVIAFGIFMLGLVQPWWMLRDLRLRIPMGKPGPFGSYVLGAAFAFGWTPCIGPILGAILTVSATSVTVGEGVQLLAAYSLGLGVPFVLAALFTETLSIRLRRFSVAGRCFQGLAAVTMIVMGTAMVTGYMSSFSYWLLDNFPALASIG